MQVPEKLTAKCIIGQHVTDTHGTHPLRVDAKIFQILHHDTLAVILRPAAHTASKQPVIIGDWVTNRLYILWRRTLGHPLRWYIALGRFVRV
jgi:hypothetical protein